MRYLLTLHMNPALWATLTDEQKNGVYEGHGAFIQLVTESGEMVETKALAEPGETKTVQVKDGVAHSKTGGFVESDASSAATTPSTSRAKRGRSSSPRRSRTPSTPPSRCGRSSTKVDLQRGRGSILDS